MGADSASNQEFYGHGKLVSYGCPPCDVLYFLMAEARPHAGDAQFTKAGSTGEVKQVFMRGQLALLHDQDAPLDLGTEHLLILSDGTKLFIKLKHSSGQPLTLYTFETAG